MRLIINGRFLGRRITGVERFATETLRALHALMEAGAPEVRGLQIAVMHPPGMAVPSGFPRFTFQAVGSRQGHAWEQWSLPRALRPDDLLINLCNTAPMLRRRQIAVVHDAATRAVPQGYSFAFRTWYRVMTGMLMRRALGVATVSQFSRSELRRFYPSRREEVHVLPEGGEHIARVTPDLDAAARYGLTARPFVLAVSSLQPNKNFGLLVEAVASLENPPFDVAIAGGSDSAVFSAAGLTPPSFVKKLGYVSDEELAGLYRTALAFVFPSRYEGFGLPPLEAMASGCPVVVARAASLPEVCGDAALYFSPDNPRELIQCLTRLISEPHLSRRLSEEGRSRSAAFTWTRAAQALVSLSRQLAAPGAPR